MATPLWLQAEGTRIYEERRYSRESFHRMPLIPSSFNPPLLLRASWMQTIAPKLLRRSPHVDGVEEILELTDGDFLELEWHRPKQSSPSTPLVILTHGLEGSTKSNYARGLISALVEKRYHVLAWNMRGCGTHRNRLVSWYHSGQTSDLQLVINQALARYPELPISLVGVSIGGNIICKYVGELGVNLHPAIRRAIAISPPLDLRSSAQVLARPSRALYMRYLLQPLRERMREKARRFPKQIDISNLSRIRSFHEFDTHYTAPIHGFQSVDHYWDSCSGLQFLPLTRIPIHIISALDDPFLSPSCFPTDLASTSQLVHLETPSHGGHVGFIESLFMKQTWLERRVLESLSLIG